MDKRRSKNLTASLGLSFYSFFTMFLTLNASDFWQFQLFIGLIIDNHNNIVNNLDRLVFSEYPKVPQLGTPFGYPAFSIDTKKDPILKFPNNSLILRLGVTLGSTHIHKNRDFLLTPFCCAYALYQYGNNKEAKKTYTVFTYVLLYFHEFYFNI